MNKAFSDTIQIFSKFARGREFSTQEIDIDGVISESLKQNILPFVYAALSSKGVFDEKHEKIVKNIVTAQILRDTISRTTLDSFFNELEKNKINYAVLKGEALAALYSEGSLRISSDIDILISPRAEKRTIAILKGYGYTPIKRDKWLNETRCIHPSLKDVEVQIALMDEIRRDIYFPGVALPSEDFRTVEVEGRSFKVLGITDGFIHTFFHFVKHFLSDGTGIRSLMDVLLYAERYKEQIDWERFFGEIKRLKFYKLFNNCVGIGIEYLGFEKNSLPEAEYEKELAESILNDMQVGGAFGKDNVSRSGFKEVYAGQRFNQYMKGDYEEYIDRRKRYISLAYIFPSYLEMSKKYKFIQNKKFLLPLAYLLRITVFFKGLLTRKRTITTKYKYSQGGKAIQDRMDFIRKLDLL